MRTTITLDADTRILAEQLMDERGISFKCSPRSTRTWPITAPASVVVHPTARHLGVFSGLLRVAGTGANLVNDAHLAALAVEHDATIVSFDRHFGRFPGVRHRVPE